MKLVLFSASLALAALLSGCASPAAAYVKNRSDLSPEQRQIILTGKIPAGEAVAGLSREDIKTAMGGDPATFDRIGNEDAWIYVQRKAAARKPGDHEDPQSSSSNRSSNGFIDAPELGPRVDVEIKTTIFFQGNRATHAQISEERP